MKRSSSSAWSIVEAKAHLSEVVAAARDTGEPQRIAERGRVVAVVIDSESFEVLRRADDLALPATGWQAFLARSAELRAKGGAVLPIPRRKGRRATKLG
jgi:prevent-host-death family protein